ncbi:hypothetical protein FPZ42_12355 [Mucilaginibacter achroorhodeus]|uniref:Uncharacterized protein n=1 Tax=Mucilaginibacter achroorhodeus TaxID=2599294 RepID=A0A563U198_9SPHI|nr:hypothetical protein [Mucilaginibacter achroorhodeus]TWR25388.1 hypothetical protein FPZ42_12355 [Mucilaginibacter achroorhodeus]
MTRLRVIKIIIILLFALVLQPFKSKAQSGQGCYIASLSTIYINNIPLTNVFLLSGAGATNCPVGSTAATPVYIISGNSNTDCLVVASAGGTVLGNGKYRNYVTAFCPLDDYIPLLFSIICYTVTIAVKRDSKTYQTFTARKQFFLIKTKLTMPIQPISTKENSSNGTLHFV